ncbi:MAG: hypothetical protein N2438_03960 [Limisphaera sp.]|nr:hypothetical protein [Limisphaera sp.]
MMEPGVREPRPGRGARVWAALLAAKLLYAAVVGGIIAWGDAYDTRTAIWIGRHWFPEGWLSEPRGRWERHFATWDAEHYLYLAARGYTVETPSIAFYPLWPGLIHAVGRLTGLSHVVVGLILANLCSLLGWWLFHRVTARRWGEEVADRATLLLVLFPGSLFYQFIYSEALFFLLVMVLWWGLEQRRWGAAWIGAYLAPLARGVGVFAVLPIAWHALKTLPWERLRRWRGGSAAGRGSEEPGGRRDGWGPWLLLAAPVLGWATYLALMWLWRGNPWAGIEAQRYWGVHAISNLWNFRKLAEGFFEVRAWHDFQGSLLDRLGFVVLMYSLPVQWRLGRDLIPWTLMLGLVPALSGTFVSYIRFEACVFPLFVALGALFCWLRKKWPFWAFAGLSLAVHLHLLWRFLHYRWAG